MFVQWSKDTEYAGKAATLHVLVIHAMIVLLTYGEPQGQSFTLLYHAKGPSQQYHMRQLPPFGTKYAGIFVRGHYLFEVVFPDLNIGEYYSDIPYF